MPYADPAAQRRFQREWCARRRAEFFTGKTCEWCGSSDELRLHHRDPNRKVSHAIWSWSARRRADEIAKCIVVCEPCHVEAHRVAQRIEAELRNPHGTLQRYCLGCKCSPCRAAKSEYERERRRRQSPRVPMPVSLQEEAGR